MSQSSFAERIFYNGGIWFWSLLDMRTTFHGQRRSIKLRRTTLSAWIASSDWFYICVMNEKLALSNASSNCTSRCLRVSLNYCIKVCCWGTVWGPHITPLKSESILVGITVACRYSSGKGRLTRSRLRFFPVDNEGKEARFQYFARCSDENLLKSPHKKIVALSNCQSASLTPSRIYSELSLNLSSVVSDGMYVAHNRYTQSSFLHPTHTTS